MHVFLAGATGVLGRRIIPLLREQGHHVTALTRDPARVADLCDHGATPVVADALDADGLGRAVRDAAPDAVMHQLTDLRMASDAANTVLRAIGTRNLVNAAIAAAVPRIIAQSVAWAYQPGREPATEQVPLDLAAPEPRRTTVLGINELESAVQRCAEWVVLRYGQLYGPDTWYAPGASMAEAAMTGQLSANGDVTSFVHVDDAAAAAVDALGWPTGPVNVCDDEPAAARAWVPAFSAAVGAPPPMPVPPAARDGAARGADNRYAQGELGWTPKYVSWREGFAALAGA